ncbi:MAG: hypothetical protein ABIR29_07315 [Chthoniobacterales bacterium]
MHKPIGRLRAYAVPSDPRPARKANKFRRRNCGQKVWVDAALARTVITCPTCRQPVPAPQKGRLWLEVCGGVILFLAGFSIGHGPLQNSFRRVAAPAAVIQENGKKGAPTDEAAPKPHWFASQSDDN